MLKIIKMFLKFTNIKHSPLVTMEVGGHTIFETSGSTFIWKSFKKIRMQFTPFESVKPFLRYTRSKSSFFMRNWAKMIILTILHFERPNLVTFNTLECLILSICEISITSIVRWVSFHNKDSSQFMYFLEP